MAKVIDGKAMGEKIVGEVREEVAKLGVKPALAVILVGEDAASKVYVGRKEKACRKAGMGVKVHRLPEKIDESRLLELIARLNDDSAVHGILVQLPLPKHVDKRKVIDAIRPEKDVDGLTSANVKRLEEGRAEEEGLAPATPLGVMELLKRCGVGVKGKTVVVVGRSELVGKPLAVLLKQAGANVIVCHSGTSDLGAECRKADILVSAVGKPGLVRADMVKEGAVVIDVGTAKDGKGRLAGDVEFEAVKKKASMITPVPGGVGPMTVAMLMRNVVKAYRMQGGE